MIKDHQKSILSFDKNNTQLIQNKVTQSPLTQAIQDFIPAQELEMSQNCKQTLSLENNMLSYFDLTIKNSLKNQNVKKAHRVCINAISQVIIQVQKQSVQISQLQNKSKSSEQDQTGHHYQINQKYSDQTQKECTASSTASYKIPQEQKLTTENSQIITSIQKTDQNKTQKNELMLIQYDDKQNNSDDQQEQAKDMFNQSIRLVQQQDLLDTKEIIQQNVQNTHSFSLSQNSHQIVQNANEQSELKQIKKQESYSGQSANQEKDKLKQLNERNIQKQETSTQINDPISDSILQKNEEKIIGYLSQKEDQQDMQKQHKVYQEIDSKQSDILHSDHINKCIQEKQKNSIEDKKVIQQNSEGQQKGFQQFLILSQENYQHILIQIRSYQFKEYEAQDQTQAKSEVGYFKERKFNLDTFKNINNSFIKNKLFEQIENQIFNILQERDFYICKLLNSNEKQDLFIGYQEQCKFQYENELIQIKYNTTQSELKTTVLMLQALQIDFKKIDIQSHNACVFILSINDIEKLQQNLKYFNEHIQEDFKFSKLKSSFEITFKNQTQQEKYQRSQKQMDFLISFFKDQSYYLCEFNDKQIEGIMLKADRQQIIESFQGFLSQQIFNISFQDRDIILQNHIDQKEIIQEKQMIYDNKVKKPEDMTKQENLPNQINNIAQQNHLNSKEMIQEKEVITDNEVKRPENIIKQEYIPNQINNFTQQDKVNSKKIIQEKEVFIENKVKRPENIINQEYIPNQNINLVHMSIQNLNDQNNQTLSEKKKTQKEDIVSLQSTEDQEKLGIFINQTEKQKGINEGGDILKQQKAPEQNKFDNVLRSSVNIDQQHNNLEQVNNLQFQNMSENIKKEVPNQQLSEQNSLIQSEKQNDSRDKCVILSETESQQKNANVKTQTDKQKDISKQEGILKQKEALQQNKVGDIENNNLKNINKQNNNLEQLKSKNLIQNLIQKIEKYDFNEYLIEPIFYTQDGRLREWSESKFQAANRNEVLNEYFKTNQQLILEVLIKKNYYLCKSILFNEKENIFIGYQSISNQDQIDYIFLIIQNPNEKVIEDYLKVKQFGQEVNQFIFKHNQRILILKKDVFINYHYLFDKLNPMINWSKEDFKKSNYQQFNCQKCKDNNEDKVNCNYCKFFNKFIQNQDAILDKMQQNQYHMQKYVNVGGQGIILQGYKCSLLEYQELVFKIYFDEDIQDEIKIMKIFEHNQNVIKYIDHIKINDKIDILVLEKCKYSLAQELQTLVEFPKQKLLKIMRQLILGLVLFRIYNILHLDIKPANILVTSSDNYVFTDFGISSLKIKNQQAEIKGYTAKFAPPEQLKQYEETDSNKVGFQSDIYSLGQTFKQIIECYKKFQPQDQKTFDFFNSIIQEHMIKEDKDKRKNCIYLLKKILKKCFQNEGPQLFLNALNFLELNEYDQNKDIIQFQKIKIRYYFCYLAFIKRYYKPSQKKNPKQFKLLQEYSNFLNQINLCYQNLGNMQKAFQYSLMSLKISKKIFQKNDPEIARSLNNVGNCYQYFGDNQMALEYSLDSLEMNQSIFKQNHPDIARSLNNVGNCYQNLGYNQKALQYTLESLNMFQKIFKENNSDIAASLKNIGNCYENLGDNQMALEYSLDSLKMNEQIFKQNHPDIARSLNNVGNCYKNLGDNQKALEYLLDSLKMFKQIFKQNHPDIARSLYNVGNCYQNLGDNQKALQYNLESLNLFQQVFKENHPDIASSLHNVGNLYQSIGDNQMALEYQFSSLKMLQQIYKENHPHIASSLNNIGNCYKNIGDNQKALEYSLESLKMKKQIYKGNHPDIAVSLNNVGNCYTNLGDNQQALEFLQESLKMKETILEENHRDIASILYNIGSCYQNIGDNKKALEYKFKSLKIFQQISKENDPHIAGLLNNIANCYQNLGDNQIALEYSLQSLKAFQLIFKDNHLLIAGSLNNISNQYQNIGDNLNALEYSLESLKMRQQILKENHPHLAQSLDNVGNCYKNLGDNQKALEYYLESLKMFQQIFNDKHPYIAVSLYNISGCYKNIGDSQMAVEYLFNSLKMLQQISKQNNSDIVRSLNNVDNCFKNLRELEYLSQSIQMKKQIFIENHPEISVSLNNFNGYNKNIQDYQKALVCQLKSFEIKKQIFKENHPEIAICLKNISSCYFNLCDFKMASEYYLESLIMFKQFQKQNDPETTSMLNNFDKYYQNPEENKIVLDLLESLKQSFFC